MTSNIQLTLTRYVERRGLWILWGVFHLISLYRAFEIGSKDTNLLRVNWAKAVRYYLLATFRNCSHCRFLAVRAYL